MKRFGSRVRIGLGLVAAIPLALIAYLAAIQLTGNFHPVLAGVAYRSAQPGTEAIARHARVEGIRTIVNLRGENPGEAWYDAEVAEARRLGIRHVDFRMSASTDMTQAEAERLVAMLKSAQTPVLIHCKSGSDRTGLASALYLAAIAHRGEAAAEGQISLRYGHISLPLSQTYAMDRTFEVLEPWLGYTGS